MKIKTKKLQKKLIKKKTSFVDWELEKIEAYKTSILFK